MYLEERKGLKFLFFNHLAKQKGVIHGVSTRKKGFSSPPFDSLNLGINVGDSLKAVENNYKLLCSSLGIELDFIVTSRQIHSDRVLEVTQREGGNPFSSSYEADALITRVPEIILMVRTADCLPIFLFDPVKRAVGIVHAGWRGTLKRITAKTVEAFIKQFDSDPGDILAGIGPGIGPCCYEIDREVKLLFEEHFSLEKVQFLKRGEKIYLNLWELNQNQLLEAGIREENLELAKICSSCNPENFFSYRRDRGRTGRFGALIGLLD